MGEDDIVYKLAFSFLKKINADIVRETINNEVSPEEFFSLSSKELIIKMDLPNDHSFDRILRQEAVMAARHELEFVRRHNITPLFLLDKNYPSRLAEAEDPPIILYKLGETDLDCKHIASIVGTRRPSPYGVNFCGNLIDNLSEYFNDLLIVSGLAFGIDAVAHKKALENNLPTAAVVAHGLNLIYPAANRGLAKEIISNGGCIISEYPSGVKVFRSNFLARNRIVAALSDVTMVIESAVKGGAMSTANYAFSYSRDVMALPGRVSDELSSGCNLLIRKQKASLLTSAADVIETTGWKPLNLKVSAYQRNLFPDLEGDAKKIYDILRSELEPVQVDKIGYLSGLNAARLMSVLGELEFDGIIVRYPGNRYSIS